MQLETERGIVTIEGAYQSEERAKMDGYDYAFTARKAYKLPEKELVEHPVKLYSQALDDRGLRHSFVMIVGYN